MKRKILDIAMAVLFLTGVACSVFFGLVPSAKEAGTGTAETDNEHTSRIADKNGAGTWENITVVLDPGHGGSDPGKVGVNDSLEKDINLSISLMAGELLEEKGFNVVYTRQDGNGLYSESDVNKKAADMRKRCELIEDAGADVVVSIHQNSYTDPDVCGAQVFYYTHSAQGKIFAEIMQQSLKDNVNSGNKRTCKANDSYYLLIHTPCPTIIVECGFLSNPAEEKLLNDEDYQSKIAQAILEGVENYFSAGG